MLASAVLDQLCANRLANADLAGAVAAVGERERLLADVAIDASTGFELADMHLMASEVALATGDLPTARRHADALAALPFHRGDAHLALARRIKVDAMAGHLDDVAELGERFRQDWVRAGRPVASNLASAAGAVAMVHGLRGDDIERRRWRSITEALRAGQGRRRTSDLAWSHTFDGLLVLDAGEPATALAIMRRRHRRRRAVAAVAPGHLATVVRRAVGRGGGARRRRRPSRPRRPGSAADTRQPDRAGDRRAGRRDRRWRPRTLSASAMTFDLLGCDYQRERSRRLVAVMAPSRPAATS